VLDAGDGRVFGVDHGVTFNADDKLRTVLWGWAGTPVPPELLVDVKRLSDDLAGKLGTELNQLITKVELTATRERCHTLLKTGAFPSPSDDWPAIPWPAF
jgi:uncharacterized repeat protein (TIGR03843 family)